MSQQEFFQGQQPEEDIQEKQPYYWSTRPQTGNIDKDKGTKGAGVPKDEPAEDDEFVLGRGYRAQDYATPEPAGTQQGQAYTQNDQNSSSGPGYQYQGPNVNINRNSNANGVYGQPGQAGQPWQAVPPWARPQRNNRRGIGITLLLIIAAFILIKPLLIVGGILLAAIGATIGIAIGVIIFPLLIFALLLAATIFSMRVIFGQRVRPFRFYGRRYWRRYQRGSWW